MRNRHVLYDIWVDDPTPLERVGPLEELLNHAAIIGGATILTQYFHPFAPTGVTGFLLLAESHLSVHTWPEEGFAAFDIFSCGDMDTDAIVDTIRQALRPVRERLQLIHRGSGSDDEDGPACPI
jgi:S-adenosylmethionine decarboxylase